MKLGGEGGWSKTGDLCPPGLRLKPPLEHHLPYEIAQYYLADSFFIHILLTVTATACRHCTSM